MNKFLKLIMLPFVAMGVVSCGSSEKENHEIYYDTQQKGESREDEFYVLVIDKMETKSSGTTETVDSYLLRKYVFTDKDSVAVLTVDYTSELYSSTKNVFIDDETQNEYGTYVNIHVFKVCKFTVENDKVSFRCPDYPAHVGTVYEVSFPAWELKLL